MIIFNVSVTWMDGEKYTYACDEYEVSNGMLQMTQTQYGAKPSVFIPTISLRRIIVDEEDIGVVKISEQS